LKELDGLFIHVFPHVSRSPSERRRRRSDCGILEFTFSWTQDLP
jgi:hypothetical protein